MEITVVSNRPTAYVGVLREEDVDGVMHQWCEPVYGARTEHYPHPFLRGYNLLLVMLQAARRGFVAVLVH